MIMKHALNINWNYIAYYDTHFIQLDHKFVLICVMEIILKAIKDILMISFIETV